MSHEPALTAEEQRLNSVWQEHMRTEFNAHSADETMTTMVANPLVNGVPVMMGGEGKEEVYEFYAKYFLPQIPPDTEIIPVSRTIGQGRLVEEMIFRFTHSIQMDWMLPGIQPTGRRVEIAMLAVVQFEGDKLAHEHLYWDQASVLVQIGLLEPAGLPVVGAEGAHSVLDRKIRLNGLLYRAELLHRARAVAEETATLSQLGARSSSSDNPSLRTKYLARSAKKELSLSAPNRSPKSNNGLCRVINLIAWSANHES